MMALLRANNIGKSFRQPDGQSFRVIDRIDLEIAPREVVCLLGASGSGKTSFLRILAGLDVDHGGEIAADMTRPGSKLGYLAQSDRLLPWRDAAANAALGLELLGKNKTEARDKARAALRQVGIEEFAGHYPTQLSGGMCQRVLLARTFAYQPRLLLFDEPMSNLDVLARRELSALVKNYVRVNDAGAVVITHSVEEACFLADRILLVTRAPARVFKEIRISDKGGAGLARDDAMDTVMHNLWQALGAAA